MYFTTSYSYISLHQGWSCPACPFPLLGHALEVVNSTDQLQASRLSSDDFGRILTVTDRY